MESHHLPAVPGATCSRPYGGRRKNRKNVVHRPKKTDTVSVSCFFFSVINEGYSVFLPLGRPVFYAVRQDLFDARLAQHQCDQSEWNEPEAHERGQTVADGMRATRMA